jgi:thioredoxin-like negative regulator of GroEL
MKPAYDKLGDEFSASSSVAIVDVDCTKEQDLCGKHGVKGYPTIKYWLDGEAKDYQQGRSFDDMKKFVTDTLERKCQVAAPEACTDKEKKFIEMRKTKDAEANKKELERLTKMAAGSSMKAELKQWLHQRLNILKQL